MTSLRLLLGTLTLVYLAGCALSWPQSGRSVREPPPPPPSAAARADWLSTRGNQIVDASGNVWMGRGVNLHDTRSCKACAFERPSMLLVEEVKRRVDFLVREWGVNLIRLNLESYPPDDPDVDAMRHYGGVLDDAGYFAEVVEIVRHIGSKPDVYVLLSLWEEPSFDPTLGVPTERTRKIWEKLAGTFVNEPYVLFGVANEPRGHDGTEDARVWESMNETVAAIRAVEERAGGKYHLITVQGTRDYGRDLSFYMDFPITAGGGVNVVYETHVYNPASDFNRLVAIPWSRLPMLIGEFGPIGNSGGAVMSPSDSDELIKLANTLRIPWTAWTFHQRCPPNLIEDARPGRCGVGMELRPTEWGWQIRERLLEAKGRN